MGILLERPSFLISKKNDGNIDLCLSKECLINIIMKSSHKYVSKIIYIYMLQDSLKCSEIDQLLS